MGRLTDIWDVDQLSFYEKGVYCLLAKFVDKNGICWPSLRTLQEMGGISRPKLIKCIQKLDEDGFVKVSKKKSIYGDADNNQYYLPHLKWDETVDKGGNSHLLGGKPQLPGGKQELPQVVTDVNQGGKPQLPGVVNDVYPNYTNITTPNNYTNPTIDESAGNNVDNLYPLGNAAEETAVALTDGGQSLELSAEFDRFWQAYPRKTGKERAWEVWPSILSEGYRAIDLAVAAGKYTVKVRSDGTAEKFIKMPHTFLAERVFEKYMPPCPKCGGSGYRGNEDGEVVVCECKKKVKHA